MTNQETVTCRICNRSVAIDKAVNGNWFPCVLDVSGNDTEITLCHDCGSVFLDSEGRLMADLATRKNSAPIA